MGWSQVRDDVIILKQNKTGKLIAIPFTNLPETRCILEQLPRTSTAIIADESTGAPYNPDWFRHEFRRIARLAEIPSELQFRDLRRTGLSELGDSGATEDELCSVSGHKTREILATYVVPSNAQAGAAMTKRAAMRTKNAGKTECG